MDSEKKDPRFTTDPKDFEVDLTQFEPVAPQDMEILKSRTHDSSVREEPRREDTKDVPPPNSSPLPSTDSFKAPDTTTEEEKREKERDKRKKQNLAVALTFFFLAFSFIIYLGLADEEIRTKYAPTGFFIFAVFWFCFIVSRGFRKK